MTPQDAGPARAFSRGLFPPRARPEFVRAVEECYAFRTALRVVFCYPKGMSAVPALIKHRRGEVVEAMILGGPTGAGRRRFSQRCGDVSVRLFLVVGAGNQYEGDS